MKEDNPNQKYDVKKSRTTSSPPSKPAPVPSTRTCVTQWKAHSGREVVHQISTRNQEIRAEGGCLRLPRRRRYCGRFAATHSRVREGLRDRPSRQRRELAAIFSVCKTPEIVHAHVEFMQSIGCKPEVVLHNLGDISMVKRWLIDTGILEEPYYFRLALGNPGWGYIEDPTPCWRLLA